MAITTIPLVLVIVVTCCTSPVPARGEWKTSVTNASPAKTATTEATTLRCNLDNYPASRKAAFAFSCGTGGNGARSTRSRSASGSPAIMMISSTLAGLGIFLRRILRVVFPRACGPRTFLLFSDLFSSCDQAPNITASTQVKDTSTEWNSVLLPGRSRCSSVGC